MPPFSIFTFSLGKHVPFLDRLSAAKHAGFTHIELYTDDWHDWLESYCVLNGLDKSQPTFIVEAAKALSHEIHVVLELEVLCLQPLRHFEGRLSQEARKEVFEEARNLFMIMPYLRTSLFLVASSFLPPSQITSDTSQIVHDFQELCDLAPDGIQIAYEALAWGTFINTWEDAWKIVKLVGRRDKFGLCIDTFNLMGRYSGTPERNGKPTTLKHSLKRTVPASRIFLLQIADAARPPQTMMDQDQLLQWSRSSRLFPFEQGAHFPLESFIQTLVSEMEYSGIWSAEYFNKDLEDAKEPKDAETLANRAMKGIKLLWDATSH